MRESLDEVLAELEKSGERTLNKMFIIEYSDLKAILSKHFNEDDILRIKDILYCEECSDRDKVAGIKLIIEEIKRKQTAI